MRSLLLRTGALVAVLFATSNTSAQPPSAPDDLKALHAGVKAIASPGSPGPVCVFGETAFPVVVDASAAGNPVVAAGRLGKGRVVAFGHNGYFSADSIKAADTQRFLANSFRWAAGLDGKEQGVTVVTRGAAPLSKGLNEKGFTVTELTGMDWVPRAAAGTVLVVNVEAINAGNAKAVQEFVEGGGGLVVGLPGWGWLQLNPGKALDRDLAANRVLAAAGLAFAGGFIEAGPGGTIAVGTPTIMSHTGQAVAAVEAWLSGGAPPAPGDAERLRAAINRMSGCVPAAAADPFRKRLEQAVAKGVSRIPVPTQKNPVGAKDPAGRLLLGVTTQLALTAPTSDVKAHPAASAFPGAVPANTARVAKTVSITVDPTGYICNGAGVSAAADIWHGTGLYAAPGETVNVVVPPAALGKGLSVRIGSHSDTLWHLARWERAPEVCKLTPIAGKTTAAANPFGGLIYITSPVGVKLGTIQVTVENAVEAPRFVSGQTTPDQWKTVREHPAPWAEFESKKVILTVPRADALKVDDPAALMAFWDSVMDADADLTQVSRERGRAERIVHDVQISAGYMHSGYPIMCPFNELSTALDPNKIRRDGAWGYFHELGHNHQQVEWTFKGTIEVTCNLYSLYCYHTLCPKATLHDQMLPDAIRRNTARYRAGGNKFADWTADPFTALVMYKQMADALGWDAYKQAFAAYHKLPPGQRPRTDDARRDMWLVQMSKAGGKNLAPFFESWSIPISEDAKTKVAELPEWKFPQPK